MNYGLYLSASGVMVNAHRQDVLSNNLANVNTTGFRPQFSDVRQRPPERIEDQVADFGVSQHMLERLGGGVYAGRHHTSFAAGAPVYSDRPLDAALTRGDSFFAVEQLDPNTGQPAIRLTRDGRFDVNAEGELVTSSGHRVLDPNDRPIQITAGASVEFGPQGQVIQKDNQGVTIREDRLQVAQADTARLQHLGENLFEMLDGDSRELVAAPTIKPRHYEASGTNAVATMMQIVSATKAATGNANMIKYHDLMMDQSINTFGRVA
ncbi:MAG: flagellar hook-basal body complex protein [Planctomycetota bacterium]